MFFNIIKRYDFTGFKSHIKNTNNINKAGLSSSCLLAIIALFTILPFVPHMDGAEARKNEAIHSTSTISVTTGQASAKLNLVPGTTAGIFATSSGDDLAKFTVISNSYTGYTLSVTAGDDYGELTTDDSNNETKFNTIDSIISESTFRDTDTYNGHWGFKPNKYVSGTEVIDNTGEGNPNNYLPSPTASGTTIDITRTSNTTPNEYTIALGARANNSFQYGAYSKTFNLVAVGNPATYAITFVDPSGDPTTTDIPAPINNASQPTSNDYITIPNVTPLRTGYQFRGWCTVDPGNTGTCPNDADTYSLNEEFYFDETNSNEQILYAIWGPDTRSIKIMFSPDPLYIESVQVRTAAGKDGGELLGTVTNSGDKVEGLIPGNSYYLYPTFTNIFYTINDWRVIYGDVTLSSTTDLNPYFTLANSDGQVYISARNMTMQEFGKIAKSTQRELIDFMTENTNYTFEDSRDGQNYTVVKLENGNIWMTQNLRYIGDTGSEPGTMVMKAATSNISADRTLSYADLDKTINSDGYDSYDYARVHVATDDQIPQGASYTATDIGIWYNYVAASAGTVTGNSDASEAIQSICPAGWRLPTSLEQEEIISYDNTSFHVNGGHYYQGLLANTDTGEWWSSTMGEGAVAMVRISRSKLIWDGTALSKGSSMRSYGSYVRCVLETPFDGIASLQDFSSLTDSKKSELLDWIATNRTYDFKDTRDNQVYKIAKLADGNIWMVDNLNLGATTLSKDLTSDNSNLYSNKTVTASTFNGWKKTTGSTSSYTTGLFIPVDGISSVSGTSYGILYNYYAATAGIASGNSFAAKVEYDICPKGWRMPDGIAATAGELKTLFDIYNSESLVTKPVSDGGAGFALAGWFSDSTPASKNRSAYYFSNLAIGSVYTGHISDSGKGSIDSWGRDYGGSIRCTLK